MTNEPEKWSSLEEIAEHLGVSKDTIRNWIRKTLSRISGLAVAVGGRPFGRPPPSSLRAHFCAQGSSVRC
ncbi:MAG: helix-turn-helix domain-containing protein [Deltaproteobacteria bacterium]|nr:helix-turn-helix domain-containing protein [Deltaproteobacteria bacterium]